MEFQTKTKEFEKKKRAEVDEPKQIYPNSIKKALTKHIYNQHLHTHTTYIVYVYEL